MNLATFNITSNTGTSPTSIVRVPIQAFTRLWVILCLCRLTRPNTWRKLGYWSHTLLTMVRYYSVCEAPSLKMGTVLFFILFLGGRLPVLWWLICAPPICRQCHLAKNERWVSGVLCFPWLYGLFLRTIISHTDVYAGCGRSTLNFIERFELGSLHSLSLYYSMRHK